MHALKDKIVRWFCLKTWRFWEALGVHLVPNHFYWPIGDSRKLELYDFDRLFPMSGIEMDLESMMDLAIRLGNYRDEYRAIHVDCGYASNGDGAILYGMMREIKPRKVIEVGSGYSTTIVANALLANASESSKSLGEIVSIEPYPKPVLREITNSHNVSLIEKKVEDVGLNIFQGLGSGDVLFIDSSHVLDIGNDVHYLYLHVLPMLPVGVIVHIHDIRFPFEYPREWVVRARKYWAEQYLLQMFLAFNDSFEVVFASNYCYQSDKHKLSSMLFDLDCDGEGWPGSFWIKRVK